MAHAVLICGIKHLWRPNMIDKLPLLLIIASILLASCAPKTRTITPLTEPDKSKIKKMAIHVQADEELHANISKMQQRYYEMFMNSEGSGFLAPVLLLAMVIEELRRSNIDSSYADEFGEDISEINFDTLLSEHIDEYFENTDASFDAEISKIQSPSILAQQGYDTVLDIKIDNIEVKLCPKQFVSGFIGEKPYLGPLSSDDAGYNEAIARWNEIYGQYTYSRIGPGGVNEILFSSDTAISKKQAELLKELETLEPIIEKYVQYSVRTWIDLKGKMVSTRNGRVIWEREELYYDPKCEYVEDMQSNTELVVNMLTRAIGDIAVNVVNEIQ